MTAEEKREALTTVCDSMASHRGGKLVSDLMEISNQYPTEDLKSLLLSVHKMSERIDKESTKGLTETLELLTFITKGLHILSHAILAKHQEMIQKQAGMN